MVRKHQARVNYLSQLDVVMLNVEMRGRADQISGTTLNVEPRDDVTFPFGIFQRVQPTSSSFLGASYSTYFCYVIYSIRLPRCAGF